VKKALIILVNTVLVLVIIGVILATWMPAIYTSDWFQKTDWPSVYHKSLVQVRHGVIGLVIAAVVSAAAWFGGCAGRGPSCTRMRPTGCAAGSTRLP